MWGSAKSSDVTCMCSSIRVSFRKSVRLKDLTEDTKSGKAPFEEVFGDPMRPMTVMPYALYQRVIDLDEDSECRHVSGSIEVPSWREKPVECMAEGRRTSDNPSHEVSCLKSIFLIVVSSALRSISLKGDATYSISKLSSERFCRSTNFARYIQKIHL